MGERQIIAFCNHCRQRTYHYLSRLNGIDTWVCVNCGCANLAPAEQKACQQRADAQNRPTDPVG